MIKNTDLRVGNYLHDREGRLCEVTLISKQNNHFDAPALRGAHTSLPHEPIPLDEDKVTKLGFAVYGRVPNLENQYEDHFAFWIGDKLSDGYSVHFITTRYGGTEEKHITFYRDWEAIKSIKFVHELQNVFHIFEQGELRIIT